MIFSHIINIALVDLAPIPTDEAFDVFQLLIVYPIVGFNLEVLKKTVGF